MIFSVIKTIPRLIKMGIALAALRAKLDKVSSGISQAAVQLGRRTEKAQLPQPSQTKIITVNKEDIIMKKSTFAAILAFLACAVGALTAFAIYLWKREKELSEYEELLFGVDEEDLEEAKEAAEAAEETEEEIVIPVEDAPEAAE